MAGEVTAPFVTSQRVDIQRFRAHSLQSEASERSKGWYLLNSAQFSEQWCSYWKKLAERILLKTG